MNTNFFLDKNTPPTTQSLKETLGSMYEIYEELLSMSAKYKQEWRYYGKTIGWQLKVSDSKKALFYLTPLKGSFRIGFAIRENEKQELSRNTHLSGKIINELNAAKKYAEGYALRLLIDNNNQFKDLNIIISTLLQLR